MMSLSPVRSVVTLGALALAAAVMPLSMVSAQPCIGSTTWQELPRPVDAGQSFGRVVDIADDGQTAVACSPGDLSSLSGSGAIWTRNAGGSWSLQTVTYPAPKSIGYTCISRDGSTVMFVVYDGANPGIDILTWDRQPNGTFVQNPTRLDVRSLGRTQAFLASERTYGNPPVQLDATGRTAIALHGPASDASNMTANSNSARVFTRTGGGGAWSLQAELPASDPGDFNSSNGVIAHGVGLSADGTTAIMQRVLTNPSRTSLDAYSRLSGGGWSGPLALAFPASTGFYFSRLSADGSAIVSWNVSVNGNFTLEFATFQRASAVGQAPAWAPATFTTTSPAFTGHSVSQAVAITGAGETVLVGKGINVALPGGGGLPASVAQFGRTAGGGGGLVQGAAPFPGLDSFVDPNSAQIGNDIGGVRVSSRGDFVVLGLPSSTRNSANQLVVPAGGAGSQSGRVFFLDTRHSGPTVQSADVTLLIGGSTAVTYNAVIAGGFPIYRWSRNGVQLTDGVSATGTGYAGSSSSNLQITSAQVGDDRAVYTCSVTNSCNGLTSRPVVLQVVAPVTPRCLADLGEVGGIPGSDGFLDNNDFIVFIDYFFNQTGCP